MAHGLSSSLGFIVAGFVYDRTQSRSLLSLKGLFQIKDFPVLSLIFFLFILANMSFPGTLNGIGELLNVSALADSVSGFISVLAFVHICLAAAFCLFL
ncbi:MAG: hypothetical protein GY928_27610 [Colwellia sp.]|nr:hypothetical protein [Colwellia sp.]